jgi:predicted oxidoreductase
MNRGYSVKAGDIPTIAFGNTGFEVSVIAQGGARMDLHPDIQTAAAHVRRVYDLGVTYFDCARSYWDGRSEQAYGIGLDGVRKNVSSRPRPKSGPRRRWSRSWKPPSVY